MSIMSRFYKKYEYDGTRSFDYITSHLIDDDKHLIIAMEFKEILKKIKAQLPKLLLPQGFTKCGWSFIRVVSGSIVEFICIVQYDHRTCPHLEAGVIPTYLPDDLGWDDYQNLKSAHDGLGYCTIEDLLGIAPNPNAQEHTYLDYVTDIDEAVAKEIELIQMEILPLLNSIKNASDCLNCKTKAGNDLTVGSAEAALNLKTGHYADAFSYFESCLQDDLQQYDYLRQEDEKLIRQCPNMKFDHPLTESPLYKKIQNEKEMLQYLMTVSNIEPFLRARHEYGKCVLLKSMPNLDIYYPEDNQ